MFDLISRRVVGATRNLYLKRSAFCVFIVYCVSFLAKQSARQHKPRWWIISGAGDFRFLKNLNKPKLPGGNLYLHRGLTVPPWRRRPRDCNLESQKLNLQFKNDLNESAWIKHCGWDKAFTYFSSLKKDSEEVQTSTFFLLICD